MQEINTLLWQIVKAWFTHESNYMINKATQIIPRQNDKSYIYYESGAQYKTYKGKAFYGMRRIFNLLASV